MTNFRKVVTIALAFLMIFSSVTVLASAWDVNVDDGFALNIGTKFFKEVDGEWVETERVRPGDAVKARVYLTTDYYTNGLDLLFFYNNDFFSDAYGAGSTVAFNPAHPLAATATGSFLTSASASSAADDMAAEGYITSDFNNSHNFFFVSITNGTGVGNTMYASSEWLFEFDLTVLDDASGSGDLFVVAETVADPDDHPYGYVNVPKGVQGGSALTLYPMWQWTADVALESQPVTTISTLTFDANGGAFADAETVKEFEGDIDTVITPPDAPAKAGATFMGWVDATIENPTLDDCIAAPTAIPEDDMTVKAFWINNVTITLDANYGELTCDAEYVGPIGTDFEAVITDPVREGYTFMGWSPALPDVYPSADTTYTAVWALNVTMTLVNGVDNSVIATFHGAAGTPFEETVNNPAMEGYYFAIWSPVLPDVYPEADTTYTAYFEANTYDVYYYVDGKRVAVVELEYGAVIPEYDYVPAEGKSVSKWFKNATYTEPLGLSEVIGASNVSLYAYTRAIKYDAVFYVDGAVYETVPTDFGAAIVAPADPTKAGYKFTGWTPAVALMDSVDGKEFHATWVQVANVIKYYVDGELYDSIANEYGAAIDAPVEPVKEGYTFEGWAVKGTTTVVDLPATMGDADAEYDAIFTVNQYTITFANTGDSTIADITQDFGTDVTAPADPVRNGFTFTGWDVEIPATMPAEDMTITATWKVNGYAIIYMIDEDTEYLTVPYDFGATVTAPDDPTRTGYSFAGWDKEIPATMPAETVTITAKWDINSYTITYMIDEDTQYKVDTYEFGADVTAPDDPALEGYIFNSWDTEIPATMPAENLVITAKWDLGLFTVTFLDYYGATYDTKNVIVGDAIPTPETDPSDILGVDGITVAYTFEGWADVPATMPAENISISPIYQKVAVKLMPVAGYTTVIDRGGYIETIEDCDGVAGTDYSAWTEGTNTWYIYGLTTRLSQANFLKRIAYTGDGRIEVVLSSARTTGTGTEVYLYDTNGTADESDDVLVEMFYVVLFGDLNGDGNISTTDGTVMTAEVNRSTAWSRGTTKVPYMVKAANLNGDARGTINTVDESYLTSVINKGATIDQTTGVVE